LRPPRNIMNKQSEPGDRRNRIVHDPWYLYTAKDQVAQFKAMAQRLEIWDQHANCSAGCLWRPCSLLLVILSAQRYSIFNIPTLDIGAFIEASKERPQTACERTRRCAAEKSDHSHRHLPRAQLNRFTRQSICLESTGESLNFLTSRAISRQVTSSV
jgi:hypothetical protein